jgi:SAM-dependent methyltransferase
VGGVEQLPSEARFDCVLATQVIEHVYDPLSFVRSLVRHVKPGGHVVLATPDIGGALRRLMGRRWPSFKVPEHVVYFDFNSLESLMRRGGVEKISRMPYPHAFPMGLISAKFGLSLSPALGRLNVWVPATTVAAHGRVPHA